MGHSGLSNGEQPSLSPHHPLPQKRLKHLGGMGGEDDVRVDNGSSSGLDSMYYLAAGKSPNHHLVCQSSGWTVDQLSGMDPGESYVLAMQP